MTKLENEVKQFVESVKAPVVIIDFGNGRVALYEHGVKTDDLKSICFSVGVFEKSILSVSKAVRSK